MANDININESAILETLNAKIDYDGGNYKGSGLEAIIKKNGGGGGLEIGDIGFTQMAIDETKGKRRVLNGQLIIQEQYVQFTNIVKASVALNADLACTEEEWQTAVTMSTNGVSEKFVIDDEAGTIRLPKYPQYLDLSINTGAVSQTVSVYGTGKALGVTDGTNNGAPGPVANAYCDFNTGNYGKSVGASASNTPMYGKVLGVTTDASKSGITGKVTIPAVQSEKIKGTYFIQVATGAETEDNIINEIELNNPFSLLDYKYSEYELNNLSWLHSNGQWNSKAIYPAVYDLLLKIYNKTEIKAGVSVKLSTASYTDTDFVLNTADETFRLPVKVKTNSTGDINWRSGASRTLDTTYTADTSGYIVYTGKNSGSVGGTAYAYVNGVEVAKETHGADNDEAHFYIPIAKGDTYKITDNHGSLHYYFVPLLKSDNGLYLYFYVGETVQNANLINAGRIEEKIANALAKPHIVDTYVNGTSWYRVYSDGWCEQGGYTKAGTTINLLKPYANTNYSISIGVCSSSGDNEPTEPKISIKSTTQFKFNQAFNGNNTYNIASYEWRLAGFIA